MKTQCPHCHTKFKAPDKSEDKKAKCPKCSKMFVITPFFERPAVKVCTSCGRQIGEVEQACMFEGEIVCNECAQKLQKMGAVSTSQINIQQTQASKDKPNISPKIPEHEEEAKWLRLQHASKMGIVVGITFIFYSVLALVTWEIFDKPHPTKIPKYPTLVREGSKYVLKTERGYTIPIHPDEGKRRIGIVPPIIAGLFLLIRSFRPRCRVRFELQALLGGLIVGAACMGFIARPGQGPDYFVTQMGNWSILTVRLLSSLFALFLTFLHVPKGIAPWIGTFISSITFLILGIALLDSSFTPQTRFAHIGKVKADQPRKTDKKMN